MNVRLWEYWKSENFPPMTCMKQYALSWQYERKKKFSSFGPSKAEHCYKFMGSVIKWKNIIPTDLETFKCFVSGKHRRNQKHKTFHCVPIPHPSLPLDAFTVNSHNYITWRVLILIMKDKWINNKWNAIECYIIQLQRTPETFCVISIEFVKFVVRIPCQSSPSLTILVPLWFIKLFLRFPSIKDNP